VDAAAPAATDPHVFMPAGPLPAAGRLAAAPSPPQQAGSHQPTRTSLAWRPLPHELLAADALCFRSLLLETVDERVLGLVRHGISQGVPPPAPLLTFVELATPLAATDALAALRLQPESPLLHLVATCVQQALRPVQAHPWDVAAPMDLDALPPPLPAAQAAWRPVFREYLAGSSVLRAAAAAVGPPPPPHISTASCRNLCG
jgi:hypothetical protein